MLTRREFSRQILAGGTVALGSNNLWQGNSPSLATPDTDLNQVCDLLIKGGTVIDSGQNLHGLLDVAIKNGKILEVSRDIPESRARKVVSAKGKIVTPGFVDLHVHCYDGIGDDMNADHYCLSRGVTTVVNAGSAGYPGIAGLRKYVINAAVTRIYALVDIGALGVLVGTKDAMANLEWVNPELTAKAAEENKPAVVGIKVRLQKTVQGPTSDLECLKRALQAADASHLPLMAHINNPASPLPDILKMMRKGDVFTHFLNGSPHGVLDANGKILPEVQEARARGVIFDSAHGMTHFSFDTAEKCLEQNFLPDTISTDLSNSSAQGPVHDLPTTVSKFMALGMDLDSAIQRVTVHPANVFNYGVRVGTLQPGSEADVGIFELHEGKFEFVDSIQGKRTGSKMLINTAVVCRGSLSMNAT